MILIADNLQITQPAVEGAITNLNPKPIQEIDPLVVPIIWQDGHLQAGEVLRTIQSLPDVLGFEVKTVGGLSNLTAGAGGHPKRPLLEQVYLSMLAAAGLDMVLLDIFHAETIAAANAADALIGEKPFAWDGL